MFLDEISEAEWDDILREISAEWTAKKLRKDHPYWLDLTRVLRCSERGMRRPIALDIVRNHRKRLGLPIPPKFEESVQQACERFCIDSDVFKARGAPVEEGLFCWPKGKGKGYWALCKDTAASHLENFIENRNKLHGALEPDTL